VKNKTESQWSPVSNFPHLILHFSGYEAGDHAGVDEKLAEHARAGISQKLTRLQAGTYAAAQNQL